MMRSNQREWGTNSVFSQVYTLYTSCKERGSWARLVLETDSNGEETVTFSVKETSHSNPAPSTSYHPPPARRGGRKTPSKARKDKVKWRAWLERKLEESREEVPSLPKPVSSADPPAPCPSYASVCISSTAETTAQATCTLPSAAELVSHNAEDYTADTSEENIYSSALLTISSVPEEKDADKVTVTTPTGTKLARMQPMDTDSEVILPPVYSIQQLDGETESDGEETNSGDKKSDGKKSDGEKPDVDYHILCSTCSFKNTFFTKKGICTKCHNCRDAWFPGRKVFKLCSCRHDNFHFKCEGCGIKAHTKISEWCEWSEFRHKKDMKLVPLF